MRMYKLRIKLLSDMCVSDGGVYNSMLDTDICHDEYGFPYIPAKRIKGCLRECAVELNDWGMEIPVSGLFGDKGESSNRANVRVSNAYLENYDRMKREAEENAGHIVFHPQNVLDHYSYIRTQTAIDYETGVADDNSLRTMRVANKGLVFEAELTINEQNKEISEQYEKALEECCKILTHMGVARTRGLGEIKVTLEPIGETAEIQTVHKDYVENADYLQYEIYLEEPVICKSVNGGESRTLDYIEGSKILGLIAQSCKQNGTEFTELLGWGELFCSNAYISAEGIRYTEVPAILYSIKNNSDCYINRLYPVPEERKEDQLNMMKHCYVYIDQDGGLRKVDVETEERYHHRRPNDKGIGRAAEDGTGDSQFYQISSIKSGQTFQGYITGSADQIKEIYDYISRLDICHIGYSRLSEYGKVRIRITDVAQRREDRMITCQDFLVKLEAPAIVYSEQAFYSTDVKDLIAEINAWLNIQDDQADIDKIEHFVNYTTVGGYNVTWNKRKPIVEAFDKGTVLHYHLKEPGELHVPQMLLLGERITEGFGEASVQILDLSAGKCEGRIMKNNAVKNEKTLTTTNSELATRICDELFEDFVKFSAVESAKKIGDDNELADPNKAQATVSNMIQMCKESSSLEEIHTAVSKRYERKSKEKQDKGKYAKMILTTVEEDSKTLLSSFSEKYQVDGYTYDETRYQHRFLVSYLQQLKYGYRQSKNRQKAKEEA